MKPLFLATFILGVGLLQMTGAVIGNPTVAGLALAAQASPAPKVFCTANGLETFSSRFVIEWDAMDGETRRVTLQPDGPRLRGPYNRRNVYGALLAYGPVLRANEKTRPMYERMIQRALGPGGLLREELGIDSRRVREIRVTVQPRDGARTGHLPLTWTTPGP